MTQELHSKIILLFALSFIAFQSFGQPQNDNCMDAFELEIAASEAACNSLSVTTVNATPSAQPTSVCSGFSFADDVWFSFTTPAVVEEGAIVIRCYFSEPFVDVPSVGMAVYEGCGWGEEPIDCFTTADPERNQLVLFSGSLSPNQTYSIRVWSTPGMSDNSGTFRICAFQEAPSDDIVLWGDNPGEGDFDGGLNGWTTVAISPDTTAFWRWAGCSCSAGELDFSVLTSPTSYNGAMIFDADSLNCCLSDDPPPAIIQQTGELISPIIDATNFPSVSLKFYQSYAALTSTTSIAYSLDGGNSWSEAIEVNADFEANDKTYSPSFVKIPILEAAGVSQFRVKFIFSGNFYNWILDDVQLVVHEPNNLYLPSASVAIPPYAMWPVTQLECIRFKGDVTNLGAAAQPNTNLNIRVIDSQNSDEVHNETKFLGTVAPLDQVTNQIIEGCFTPESTAKNYSGIYDVSSDSLDYIPEDNIAEFEFETTDFVFAKENGGTQTVHPGFFAWEFGEPHSWAYGNFFHIVKGSEEDPKVYAQSGTFAIGNADASGVAGEVLNLHLYRWDADTNNDGNMDSDERTLVAYAWYNIQGTETPLDLITKPLISYPNGDPNNPEAIQLDSNQDYVLMLEYSTQSIIDIEFVASNAFNYSSQIALSLQNGSPRYASMFAASGALDTVAYNSIGFGRDIVPVVRLNLTDQLVNTETPIVENIKLALSPNPVSSDLYLSVSTDQMAIDGLINIFDLNGRLLDQLQMQNIRNETFRLDVNNYASGAYFLQFVTKNKVLTERFIVQK